MVKGVYSVGKTGPRDVPVLAPNCLKFTFDGLARHPQPMPSTHTVFCSLGYDIGVNGPATQEGAEYSPFSTTT